MVAALELAVVQVVVRAVELVVEADLVAAAVPVEVSEVGMVLVVASVVGQEQVVVPAVELVAEEDLVAAAVWEEEVVAGLEVVMVEVLEEVPVQVVEPVVASAEVADLVEAEALAAVAVQE
jgi:hypothetical protein